MRSHTVVVSYQDRRWTVRKPGTKRATQSFATKSEAVAAAKAIARATQPSQIAIIGRNGRLQPGFFYGLPRIPRPPYRSPIAEQIERAVLKVCDMMEAKGA